MFIRYGSCFLTLTSFAIGAAAATPAKVDFGKDVLPILRQNCFGCHGPSQQMSGLRLDRKSSVFKGGMRRVVPGSSANSFLYHRVSGSAFGLQMPPTGPLRAEQIATIKAWIDEGAPWPDALSNEAELPPLNSKAVAMVEALRAGDRQGFLKAVDGDPKLLNARGPEGSTPFQYAVLYGDAPLLEQLLKRGANVNTRNDAKATALMWAATDLEKTRVLLMHGADVNARSDDGRTPLMIAAGCPGGEAIVKLLLDHGANPNPNHLPMAASPLSQAALAADAASMHLLLDRGADAKQAGPLALMLAVSWHCAACEDLLVKRNLDKDAYTFALQFVAAYTGAAEIKLLLDHGADVNAVDPFGHTALHYAAASDLHLGEVVKLLIAHGAKLNAATPQKQSGDAGMTTLDLARLNGQTPVVDLLLKAGATSAVRPVSAPKPQPAASLAAAVEKSLPLLQRADAEFTSKSGCVSCHSENLAAMAIGLARKHGYRVDERTAAQQVKVNAAYLEHSRETLHQGYFAAQAGSEAFGDMFGPGVLAYIMVGLDAEGYKADFNTDAVAMYLKSRQSADGQWRYADDDQRQPLCEDYTGQTALSMRALQLYPPKTDTAEYAKAVQRAAAWLARTAPLTNEDRVWRLHGLAWAGLDKAATTKAAREVAGMQRPDGGWAQNDVLPSDAYATGHALVALHAAGMPVTDAVYQRGLQFLRNTQMADGSWFVKTRALAIQPFFDSGFPHGINQAISAAGTSWATMALTLASDGARKNTEVAPPE